MQAFVNREEELDRLRACYGSNRPELAVVYGRRRMGKTELVRRSLADRPGAVHFQATQTTKQIQLEDFLAAATKAFPDTASIRPDWEPLLAHLAGKDAVVVLDEFPYLVDADPSLPSVLQRLWDHTSRTTRSTLVLVGSSIGMMEEKVLSGASPLHGRATMRCEVQQLSFGHARKFWPRFTNEASVQAWSIYGGTPHYLQTLDPAKSLPENVHRTLLSKNGILHEEPEFSLRTELPEPKTYFAILMAVAQGRTTPQEIAHAAGLPREQVGYYLKTLQTLRIVGRETPATEDPLRSRRGTYQILDPLFRFWFRFVYGRNDRYDEAGPQAFQALIAPELPGHVGEAFELLCHQAVRRLFPDLNFTRIGRWWFRELEADLVGLTTGRTMLVGECKFTRNAASHRVLQALERKAEAIRWTPQQGGPPEVVYALFSKGGFTQALQAAAADRDDLHLFTLDPVVEALSQETPPTGRPKNP